MERFFFTMKTELPLKIKSLDDEGYHLFITARINGKLVNLLVDTGASKTVFDLNRIERFADKGLIKDHAQLSTGLGTNSMKSHQLEIKKIKLGACVLLNYDCFLLDLSHVNASYHQLRQKPIDGVLGSDLLVKLKAKIDYSNSKLTLFYSLRMK